MRALRFAVSLLIGSFSSFSFCGLRQLSAHRNEKSAAAVAIEVDGGLLPSADDDMTNSSGRTFNGRAHANISDHGQSQQSGSEEKDPNHSSGPLKAERHHGIDDCNPSQTETDITPPTDQDYSRSIIGIVHHTLRAPEVMIDTLSQHLGYSSLLVVALTLLTCVFLGCTSVYIHCWNHVQSISRQNEGTIHVGAVPDAAFQGFEWGNAEPLLYSLDAPCDLGLESVPPRWTADAIREVLVSSGIDANVWSEGQLAELSNQLSSDLVCLVRGNTGELQIRVDIVQIILTCPRDWVVLQVESLLPDGSDFGELREQDPEGRMNRKETLWESTLRCLFGQTGAESFEVKFESMTNATQKNEWNVDQVPGLLTVTRRYTVHASVTASTRADLDQFVLGSQGLKAERRAYKWVSLQSYEMPSVPTMRTALNDFNTAILPWNVAAVQSLMEMHGIIDPVESFGKTLEDLSCALSAGKLSLGVIKSENRLMCIIEEVSLLITSIEGTVFISPGSLRMLPTTVKLSNENIHMAAFRLLQEFFGMHAPLVEIEHQTVVTDKLATSKGHVTRTILVFAKMNVPVNSLTRWDVTNKARKPTST